MILYPGILTKVMTVEGSDEPEEKNTGKLKSANKAKSVLKSKWGSK